METPQPFITHTALIYPSLMVWAQRKRGKLSEDAAADAVHDTLITCEKALSKRHVDYATASKYWYTAVRNILQPQKQATPQLFNVVDEDLLVDCSIDPTEYFEHEASLLDDLLPEIDELPELLRDVLLRVAAGQSPTKIAKELGIVRSTLYTRLRRAREILVEKFGSRYEHLMTIPFDNSDNQDVNVGSKRLIEIEDSDNFDTNSGYYESE